MHWILHHSEWRSIQQATASNVPQSNVNRRSTDTTNAQHIISPYSSRKDNEGQHHNEQPRWWLVEVEAINPLQLRTSAAAVTVENVLCTTERPLPSPQVEDTKWSSRGSSHSHGISHCSPKQQQQQQRFFEAPFKHNSVCASGPKEATVGARLNESISCPCDSFFDETALTTTGYAIYNLMETTTKWLSWWW